MGENIKEIRNLRDKLKKGGMTQERLDIFDTMFGSYERKLNEEEDFTDSETLDFYKFFALEINNLEKGE